MQSSPTLFLTIGLVIGLGIGMLPGVGAVAISSTSGGYGGVENVCPPTQDIIKVAGVVNAGEIALCGMFPSRIPPNQAGFLVQGQVRSPETPLGLLTTYTWLAGNVFGCSKNGGGGFATPGQQTDNVGAFGSASTALWNFTFNPGSNYCAGQVGVTVAVAGAVTVAHPFFSFAVVRDNLGNLNTTVSGTTATVLSGTVGITGSLTATLAGTLALTGTVGLSQSGAWSFALTGIPDTQQEIQAIADALNAGLDVSICPISSPCYQVLSGGVTVTDDANGWAIHQDQACGATLATRCYGELSGININQTVGNVTIPSNLTLNGGSIPITVNSGTADFWVPIFFWLVGLVIFLRIAKLLAAAACMIGLGFSLMASGNEPLQILALVILAASLWMEAFARERIYVHFFKPPAQVN